MNATEFLLTADLETLEEARREWGLSGPDWNLANVNAERDDDERVSQEAYDLFMEDIENHNRCSSCGTTDDTTIDDDDGVEVCYQCEGLR